MSRTFFQQKSVRTAALTVLGGGGAFVAYSHISARVNRLDQGSVTRAHATPLISPDGKAKTDVLIVGSGGGALTAALRARAFGLDVLVVEKHSKLGGTSNYSGSGCWVPNSHVHNDSRDSVEKALTYMEAIIGDAGPASSRERKLAFLNEGPKMVKWMADEGYRWTPTPAYPDYFPYHPGGQVGGRSIEANIFDSKLLGPWLAELNMNPARPPLPLYTYELSKIVRYACSLDGFWTAAKIYGWRRYPGRLLGQEPVTLGVSMISQLLYMNINRGTSVWLNSPMTELVTSEDGSTVTGAIVERDGRRVTIEASKGVILAAGGFARNEEMRKKYQAKEITAQWTSTTSSDMGEPIQAAMNIGCATALLDSAWWGAAMWEPVSKVGIWCLYDRGLPHSMIVDQTGRRFANESQNYNSIGREIWERQKVAPSVPSFLIMDSTHRSRYLLAGRFKAGGPNSIPQSAIDSGFITKADSIPEMAEKLGLPVDNLVDEVTKFNGYARQGVDADFQRGASVYDKFLGDPSYKGNRNLGEVAKAPFYAVKVWPGDLGTKGGVLTDERARALRENPNSKTGYDVIKGLYAIGNSSASVMGRTYAGAGATLGPALTFAYIAVNDIAESKR